MSTRADQAALLALLDTVLSEPLSFSPVVLASMAERARDMIVALDSSLTAAEKDAARLDWLDSLGFTAYCNRDPETRERGHVVFVNEDAKGARKGIVRQTIREAIDQAMGEANGR